MQARLAGILCVLVAAAAAVLPLSAAAETKLSVTQYGKIISSLPWAVALEKGWLKENGLNIDGILSSDGGGTSVRNMLASDLPFGEVAVSAAVAAHLKAHLDIEAVYGGGDSIGELAWVSMPDSGVKTIADIRGKTVAYTSPQSATEMLLRLVLDKAGIPASSVKMVAAGGLGAIVTALKEHGIDAGPIADPILALNEDKFHTVFAASDYFPRYMWYVGITTKDFAQKHGDQVRALIAARRKAVQFIHEHPEETEAIYAKVWGLDQKTAALMLKRAMRYKYWSEGDFDKEGIDTMLKGMLLAGVIDKPFDIKTIVNQDFLPPDLRRPL